MEFYMCTCYGFFSWMFFFSSEGGIHLGMADSCIFSSICLCIPFIFVFIFGYAELCEYYDMTKVRLTHTTIPGYQ